MKKSDFIVIFIVIIFLSPFFIFDGVYAAYKEINSDFPLILAFLKFAVLATFGEMLGMRIRSGKYYKKGFGLLPRCIVWGLLGIWISIAMGVFRNGVPAYLEQFTIFKGITVAMAGSFSGLKLLGAFFISLVMNTCFAPVFMTLHKITDSHIIAHSGKISSLIKPIRFVEILKTMNWKVQWNFVFLKTIPFFWIPAHTLTFILPSEFQVLFAAFCSIILGLILSIASVKK